MSEKTAKGKGSEIDDHDLPTEPVPRMAQAPEMDTLPVTPQQPITLGPFDQSPSYPAPPNAPKFDVYPYHQSPATPQPYPLKPQPAVPVAPAKNPALPARQTQRDNPFYLGFIPLCIGLFFVCLQILLLTRFVLRLLGIVEGVSWVNTVYALCDIILLPFQTLLPPLQLPAIISTRVELYTLLAVLVYGMLSRLIVRLLKIFLGIRSPVTKQGVK
ncbi:MAG: hypothetical protein PVS3B1_02210 [Ktedonobacteraceae bacterium]